MMKIFTYCSAKSSKYGYQFAAFSFKDQKVISSSLSNELEDGKIMKKFSDWCVNKSGWQLVLMHIGNKDKYLLMLGQLEKSRELKKRDLINKGEKGVYLNDIDSDYYMTLGFYGDLTDIKPLAMAMLQEYLDGFRSLFDALEKTISKSENAERYEIDAFRFNEIFHEKMSKMDNSKEKDEVIPAKLSILEDISRKWRLFPSPKIFLSLERAKKGQETRKVREGNVKKCIEFLNSMENFSEHTLLYIAYDDVKVDERINIHIVYEYLWYNEDADRKSGK